MWVTRQIATHTGTHHRAYRLSIDCSSIIVHCVCTLHVFMDLKRSMTLFLDDSRGREEMAAEKSDV